MIMNSADSDRAMIGICRNTTLTTVMTKAMSMPMPRILYRLGVAKLRLVTVAYPARQKKSAAVPPIARPISSRPFFSAKATDRMSPRKYPSEPVNANSQPIPAALLRLRMIIICRPNRTAMNTISAPHPSTAIGG